MKIDMSDALIRQSPNSVIGQVPVEQLRNPVLINREGENTALHDLQDLLEWMTRIAPPTGPLTRKPFHMNHIEPVQLVASDAWKAAHPGIDGRRPIQCRYQGTLNILLATAVEYGHTTRAGDLLDMRADP